MLPWARYWGSNVAGRERRGGCRRRSRCYRRLRFAYRCCPIRCPIHCIRKFLLAMLSSLGQGLPTLKCVYPIFSVLKLLFGKLRFKFRHIKHFLLRFLLLLFDLLLFLDFLILYLKLPLCFLKLSS